MSNDDTLLALAQRVELVEAQAFTEFFANIPTDWGCHAVPVGGATAFVAPPIPRVLFNRVLGVGVVQPATEAQLDALLTPYEQAGVTEFAIQLSPAAQPAALPAWLRERGFAPSGFTEKMWRTTENPPELTTALRIERIGPEAVADFARIACTVFEMPTALEGLLINGIEQPHWYYYLAYDGDLPVATAMLGIYGEVGSLMTGATLPSHRRRGAQGALMARRVQDAAVAGCRWVITETGEDHPDRPNPSLHNMLRCGFQRAYPRPDWMRLSA